MSDVIPYDDQDRLSEDEFGRKIGKSRRTLRLWRDRGVGPPFSMNGRQVEYSWSRYLRFRADNEVQPVRSRREPHQPAA